MNKPIIPVVCGPTGTGKTKFAISLAKKLNGVLINIDSRQIYKHMKIGTNAGDLDFIRNFELETSVDVQGLYQIKSIPVYRIEGVEIFGLHFLDPDKRFNLFSYLELARMLINHFWAKDVTSIFVGGTGLYVDGLVKSYQNYNEQIDQEYRTYLETLNIAELHSKIKASKEIELSEINVSDRMNKYRLMRLLERHKVRNPSSVPGSKPSDATKNKYIFKLYYPKFKREDLYDKLNSRVGIMFHDGFIGEVKDLLKMGYKKTDPGLKVMGYSQIVKYLEGKMTLEECKEKIKQAHRNYARRQITWFEGKGRGYELEKVKMG